MTVPLTPGVYVREDTGGARAIEAAPTAVTIFVGEAERGPIGPTPISSANQYRRLFGGYLRHDTTNPTARLFMPFAVDGFFANGGPRAYVLRLVSGTAATSTLAVSDGTLNAAINASAPGVWGDSVRIAITNSADGDAARFTLRIYYQAPGETAHTEVEVFEGLSADPLDEKYVVDQLARSSFVTWNGADVFRPTNQGDATATPPGEALAGGTGGDGSVAPGDYAARLAALDRTDDAALIVCGSELMLTAATEAEHNNTVGAVLAYVEGRPQRDLFLVADVPRSTASNDPVGAAVGHARTNIAASDHMALYWPRIVVADPIGLGRSPTLAIPAAGHVAGLYGRTDGRRGVAKVAAGVEATVAGSVGLDFQIIDRDQDRMNPHGLNAIRTMPGAGRVVWGGRTRRPTTQWRYINVRRTAMFLRRSIFNGIQWAVFEGNDETLWASLRATIGAFMEAQFRLGTFAGETSREAYFVKCDSDTTTPDDQAAGVVNVQVGFAPLRPAEFVIVTLSQQTATP